MSQIVLLLAWTAGVAAAEPADAATVRGRVLDPDGKPVKGARLYSLRLPKSELKSEEDIEFPQRAETEADGRFRFELPRSDMHPKVPLSLFVIAAADGYGVNWGELSKDGSDDELILRLVKDQPIEGRIISTEGKPLAGIRVRALTASKTSEGQLDDFLTDWKRNWQMAAVGSQKSPAAMLLPQEEKSCQAVTDKDGRFRLQGAGAERLVLLRLRGPGLTPAVLFVLNRAGFDAAPVNKAARDRVSSVQRRLNPPLLLYGPTLEYVAMPGRPIEGTVREIGSGKPVAGFRISISGSYSSWAVSDEDGHYKLESIPKMRQYLLFASPPEKSSWLQTRAIVDDVAGVPPLRVDFTVARGIVVSGRVIDKTTGKGAFSMVRFAALPGNKFFDKPGHAAYRYQRLMGWTNAEGSFRLVVFPGPGVLTAVSNITEKVSGQQLSPYKQAEFDAEDRERVKIIENDSGRFFIAVDNTYESLNAQHAVKALDLAADAGAAKCNLFVERGETRTIRIEDADGKPLMGTMATGMDAMPGHVIPIRDAIALVLALDPKKPRRLLFLHVKRNLAGTLTLRGDEKEPVVVRLKRAGAVTGRVLDADGQPLAGADVLRISPDASVFALYQIAQDPSTVRTDKDGRFRIEGIVPDVKFTLGFTRGRTYFRAEPRFGFKQVQTGATLNLGDVRVTPSLTSPQR